jgi:hypothetical protein
MSLRPARPPTSLKPYIASVTPQEERVHATPGTGSKRYPCNHCHPYVLVTMRNGYVVLAELHHQWTRQCGGKTVTLNPKDW